MGLCGDFFREWANEIRVQKFVPQQKLNVWVTGPEVCIGPWALSESI